MSKQLIDQDTRQQQFYNNQVYCGKMTRIQAESMNSRQSLSLAIISTVAAAKVNWNLETSFLMSLSQQDNYADEFIFDDDFRNNRHLYPTWVSEMTCSTQCVDIHQNEEFCVASSVCQHAKWHHSFLKHKTLNPEHLSEFDHMVSSTHCDVWGESNRCDGTLCSSDFECQSGCCGAFVSFTHERCLPMLGDYCAGRDKTREGYVNPLHPDEHYSLPEIQEMPEEQLKPETLPEVPQPDEDDFDDARGEEPHYYDTHYDRHEEAEALDPAKTKEKMARKEAQKKEKLEELYQRDILLNLEAQTNATVSSLFPQANELSDNGSRRKKKNKDKKKQPQKQQEDDIPNDYYDDYGDRVYEDDQLYRQQYDDYEEYHPEEQHYEEEYHEVVEPCRDHGYLHLCDGNICEYDGHCSSGCCAQVIGQEYKRCVPMLVGDYCARALDPVFLVKQSEDEEMLEQVKALPAAAAKADLPKHRGSRPESQLEPVQPTELPCNVFGTVDRCDGMACEHDGNCYSGCCALFVSGDQKRCMPLVGGDMCPIAIDVVDTFQIIEDGKFNDRGFREVESQPEPIYEQVVDTNPHHMVAHEDPPIIEKGEHSQVQDVPFEVHEKSEHDLGFVQPPVVRDPTQEELEAIKKVHEKASQPAKKAEDQKLAQTKEAQPQQKKETPKPAPEKTPQQKTPQQKPQPQKPQAQRPPQAQKPGPKDAQQQPPLQFAPQGKKPQAQQPQAPQPQAQKPKPQKPVSTQQRPEEYPFVDPEQYGFDEFDRDFQEPVEGYGEEADYYHHPEEHYMADHYEHDPYFEQEHYQPEHYTETHYPEDHYGEDHYAGDHYGEEHYPGEHYSEEDYDDGHYDHYAVDHDVHEPHTDLHPYYERDEDYYPADHGIDTHGEDPVFNVPAHAIPQGDPDFFIGDEKRTYHPEVFKEGDPQQYYDSEYDEFYKHQTGVVHDIGEHIPDYIPLSDDYTEWDDDLMHGFQDALKERYPDLAGELVFDHDAGMWKISEEGSVHGHGLAGHGPADHHEVEFLGEHKSRYMPDRDIEFSDPAWEAQKRYEKEQKAYQDEGGDWKDITKDFHMDDERKLLREMQSKKDWGREGEDQPSFLPLDMPEGHVPRGKSTVEPLKTTFHPSFHGALPSADKPKKQEEQKQKPDSIPRQKLQPKERVDESKLRLPSGKAKPMFKDPVSDAMEKEIEQKRHLKEGIEYGVAYEHHKKASKNPTGMGLAPKSPLAERRKPVGDPDEEEFSMVGQLKPRRDKLPELILRKPCYAYGDFDKCDGMMCEEDDECVSSCCSRVSADGYKQCHAQISGGFCPRAVAPKIDYTEIIEEEEHHRTHRANAIDRLRGDGFSIPKQQNTLPAYKGQDGCKVSGKKDQCDGQPCKSDVDCHSGCCGHFVSFSLRRCLPLTEDGYCPRFLEPSVTSPLPSKLPPIESTIKDMYNIQDRVRHVQQELAPHQLDHLDDMAQCRSHGHKELCDGFTCANGKECASGCCGSFANLKEEFCLPQQDDQCISHGFHYGPFGLSFNPPNQTPYQMITPEPLSPGEDSPYDFEQEQDTLPVPPQLPDASDPDGEAKKENAFYFGVIAGVAIWVLVAAAAITLYYCCMKRRNDVLDSQVVANESSNAYHNLPGQREENASL